MARDFVSITDVMTDADRHLRTGGAAAPRVWPTGFPALDHYLNGGFRAGELVLLGGPQGLGKTTLILQVLRNVAAGGGSGIYFSFEHDEESVLERFLAIEAGETSGVTSEELPLREIRRALSNAAGDKRGLVESLQHIPLAADAVARLQAFGDRLLVSRSAGGLTTVDAIRERVRSAVRNDPPVVVVDYLQKVAVPDGPAAEDERVTSIVEALKDMALELEVPVVAIVAADKEGIAAGRRLRVHNLRGSSALAYEADIVLILNDKYDVVARHHLVYDTTNAERFRNFVVMSIEKNRSGIDKVDLEFRKRFEIGRYETDGNLVEEQLVDERVFVE